MRKLIGAVVGIAMAAGAGLWAPRAAAESLADALISAYRSSNLLEQNRALLRVRDEDVARAVSTLRPVIDFVVRSNWSNSEQRVPAPTATNPLATRVTSPENLTTTLSITAEITLWDAGANRYGIGAAQEIALATRQALVGIENRVLLLAVQSYLNVRLARDTVALQESNVRVLERQLTAARDRFDLGEITRTDVAIAESRLAAARAALARAQGDLAVEREAFRVAVGRYPGQLREPPRAPATARSLEEARSIAVRTHHRIKQLQHQVAADELNVLRAEAAMRPRVTASANYGINDSGLQQRSVGIGLSQRLYQGGALSAQMRQAIASRDATRAQLHQAVAEVERDVAQAWARRDVARASITATDRQIAAARAALEGVTEEAKLGARTTLEVLDAEQELLEARAQRLSAVTQEYLATYALLDAMGLLTVDHLRLGIPTYDVSAYYNAVKSAPSTPSLQGQKLDRVLRAIGGGDSRR
ncbi:MAG: TolC family outer membrane protein [Gemmobacter sp.]